ncbi:hypothetical protein I6F14_33515 [Bradyrhizobium sp. IC3069]|uniref:hypothetical protein n=1 Tax=unclassified Bradyrhizobium TaxID=2631580 RepID=UPI001CD7527F|nr:MULTISPECIES: hypothetical protein [unclassified Bradyrhizobium]MCA1365385.1 hypothetical protein [Bradyrhizobium sp. IC4059]MCA1522854.1 hypothetical protein [Bradyrhizobium sp. IC3069]
MHEFGLRRNVRSSGRFGEEAPDKIKRLISAVATAALIAASFFVYKAFYPWTNRDPLLEKRASFAERVQRHASNEELPQVYPSLDTGVVVIAFGNEVYRGSRFVRSSIRLPNNRTDLVKHLMLGV